MNKKLLSLVISMILLATCPMKSHAEEEKWLTTGSFNLQFLYPDFMSDDAPDPSTVDASFVVYGNLISPASSVYRINEKVTVC